MAILPPSRDTNHTNGPRPKLIPSEFLSFTTSLPYSTQPHTKHNTMLQDQHKFDFSDNHSRHLDSLWDSHTSPQSTLSSVQGSPEGSSSPTSHDFCWESTYDTMEMLEKMMVDEKDSSEYHSGYVNQRLETSNIHHSLLQGQIRAVQLSPMRQDKILSEKQDPAAHGAKKEGQISQQSQKKGKGVNVGCDYGRRTRPPFQQARSHQQNGSRDSYSGTGVFLPRGETGAPFEAQARKKAGKGCSRVLIPARVVQALQQLHFHQMAAKSGPTKPAGFPSLHDVLVSNKDGMYSLQSRQSRNQLEHIQDEMVLPQEWTY